MAGYLRSSPFLSLTGHRLDCLKGLLPFTLLPFGTQSRPLTPTTPHCKSFTRCFSSTSLHSSFMTPDAGTTTTLTPPHTDPSSTSDCGKLKLVSGFHLLMIYFKPTSSPTSNLHPKHPPGKPNVPGQPTSLSLAAGVSPFVLSKKTTARLHHKTPLTKLPSNSFVPKYLPKNKPPYLPPLPKPNAPATNT